MSETQSGIFLTDLAFIDKLIAWYRKELHGLDLARREMNLRPRDSRRILDEVFGE